MSTDQPTPGSSDETAVTPVVPEAGAGGAEQPTYGTTGPTYGTSEPARSGSEPAYGASEPDYSRGEPAYGTSEPAYGAGPTYGTERPTYGAGQPTYGTEQPPAWSTQAPPYGEPTTSFGAPSGPSYGGAGGHPQPGPQPTTGWFAYGSGQPGGHEPGPGSQPHQTSDTRSAIGVFLGKLFDLSFTSFVTPSIVKIVYVLAMVVIGLGWLGYSLVGFARNPGLGLLFFLVIGPLIGLVYLVVVRISLELYLAVIRLAEDVRELKEDRASSTTSD